MILFVFESTHAVISAEKKSLAAGIKCNIIPVPRSISSQCGLAVEINDDDEAKLSEILNNFEITYSLHRDYKK